MGYVTPVWRVCLTKRGIWIVVAVSLVVFVLESRTVLLERRLPTSPVVQPGRQEEIPLLVDPETGFGETLSGGFHSHKYHKNLASGLSPRSEMATVPKLSLSSKIFTEMGKFAQAEQIVDHPVAESGYGGSTAELGDSAFAPLGLPFFVSHSKTSVKEEYDRSENISTNAAFKFHSISPGEEPRANSSHVSPVRNSPRSSNHSSTFTDITMIQSRKVETQSSTLEMKNFILRDNGTAPSLRRSCSSSPDKEMCNARIGIENAPIVKNDQELYAPAFWNLTVFKRSYELMEKTLKVYIYKEGEKPIFHQPVLDGIYASEGWFMKQIEENSKFVVSDPGKAHLFYMPFSSSTLRYALFVPGPHAKRPLLQYLNDYIRLISTKYPFWNRTGGANHFLVACHDWTPYLTGGSLRHSIRVVCNADVSKGFELGKDVSLPEANVRRAQNPVGDLGGRLPKTRHFLAFFSGKMHGNVRPILLKHWRNKDPDMKIFETVNCGSKCKGAFAEYMKNSMYCICPSGYHAFNPRVVEAIRYECVPVIISDDYVLPLSDILNWEAFAVVVLEKDIPKLRDILLSIPKKKYLSLHLGVRKVKRHFLWHTKPVKYDMFHMILHSVWLSRLNQTR